jgi:DNA replication and repair protein RecF
MYFSRIQLTNFRNYESLDLSCCAGINCFTGNNGEGKTNILEGVHFLCMTRGWQSKHEKYALKEGEAYFSITGSVAKNSGGFSVQCNYLPSKGKRMLVDGKVTEKMSEHLGRIPIVSVLPNDTLLIHGPPANRRRFMDALISQYSPEYLAALIRYENALEQRNALLSLMAERRFWDPEQLDLWDVQLASNGVVISDFRNAFLVDFVPIFHRYYNLIVSEKELPEMTLDTHVAENTSSGWLEMLQAARNTDRFAQKSTVGIHKDDLCFEVEGQSVRNFGSQGQQKTFAISLKLAQYEVLRTQSGKDPVLLLDDIFDKLDENRLASIARLLTTQINGQVFITDTSLPRMHQAFQNASNPRLKFFRVTEGKVLET